MREGPEETRPEVWDETVTDLAPNLARTLSTRYLDLVEAALTGVLYEDAPMPAWGFTTFDPVAREHGRDWPSTALTMVGTRRLRNFRTLVERVLHDGIPGDILETGVWRGGACIMARAVLAAHGVTDRRIVLADSFQGLPPGDGERFPEDAGSDLHTFEALAVSADTVRANFRKFGLLDDQVLLIEGFFEQTMPTLALDRIAVLRLDGDMYGSTVAVLEGAYDKVSPGGWIIIDDYEVVWASKQAVTDFLARRGLVPTFQPIDGVGVFFQKPA